MVMLVIVLRCVQSYFVQSFVNSESTLESRDIQVIFVKHIPSLLLSASDNKLERYTVPIIVIVDIFCVFFVSMQVLWW